MKKKPLYHLPPLLYLKTQPNTSDNKILATLEEESRDFDKTSFNVGINIRSPA